MRDAVDSLGLARTLIDYNEWASDRVLRACGPPARRELQPHPPRRRPWEHLRPATPHRLGAAQLPHRSSGQGQRSCRQRRGREGLGRGLREPRRHPRGLRARHKGLRDFADGLTVERWAEAQRTWPGKLPLGMYVMQLLLHSQHHRGETAALLTELGYSPGDLDFIFFAFERPG